MNRTFTRYGLWLAVRTLVWTLCFLFLFSGCSCRTLQDLSLTPFERTLIPFQGPTDLLYLDQDQMEVPARTTAKTADVIQYSETESCDPADAERQFINLRIPDRGLDLEITVQATEPTFQIAFDDSVYWPSCPFTNNYPELISDVSVDGFDFAQVFRFEYCIFEDSSITFILYSAEEGIEFIKFDDGSYLYLLTE